MLTLLCRALFVLVSSAQAAGMLYVDDDAAPGGDGATWQTAHRFLADALDAADAGVTEIRVAQGTYVPDRSEANPGGTGDREASFALVDSLALRGGYLGLSAGKGEDPDARDVALYESVLSGDLLGDDRPGFAGYADNSRHVVRASGAGPTAVLDGFTIIGGNADGAGPQFLGGGLLNQGADPTVMDCTFEANSAGQGGGMYNAAGCSPAVSGCSFLSNRADVSGGGMQNASASPAITDCVFAGNTADAIGGGGMYNGSSSPILASCAFSANETLGRGGAMHNAASAPDAENCTFDENSALARGGAVYSENGGTAAPHFTGCAFTGNIAFDEGGAITSVNTGSGPVLAACTFDGNVAVDDGGALRMEGAAPFDVTGCSFTDNLAGDHGGAAYLASPGSGAVFEQCLFDGNTAHGNGGAVHQAGGAADFKACTMSGNTAEADGGAFFVIAGEPALTACTLAGNSALRGGALRANGGAPALSGCDLLDNFAESAGGAVHLGEQSAPVISGCTFAGNSTGAFSSGGALYSTAGNAAIDGCVFEDNSANFGGALYYVAGSAGTLTGSLVKDNVAFVGGGAFIWNSAPAVTATTFMGNSAVFSLSARGGGVHVLTASPVISGCTFDGNSADVEGGGAYVEGGSAKLAGCTFAANIAPRGGGAHIAGGTPSLTSCVFTGNTATGIEGGPEDLPCDTPGLGGGLAVGAAFPAIVNCSFSGNAAACGGDGGGASMLIGTVANCILWGNTDGGGADQSAQLHVTGPVTVKYSCIQGLTGSLGGIGNTGGDPLLRDADGPDGTAGTADDDLALSAGSPCIDAADNTAVPAGTSTDAAGHPRFHDDPGTADTGNPDGAHALVDMGALEFQGDSSGGIADLNGDGSVGVSDLLMLLGAFGPCPDAPAPCPADLDGDGAVGVTDLLMLLASWE